MHYGFAYTITDTIKQKTFFFLILLSFQNLDQIIRSMGHLHPCLNSDHEDMYRWTCSHFLPRIAYIAVSSILLSWEGKGGGGGGHAAWVWQLSCYISLCMQALITGRLDRFDRRQLTLWDPCLSREESRLESDEYSAAVRVSLRPRFFVWWKLHMQRQQTDV